MPSHMPSDWTDPEIPGFVALPVERNRQQEVFTPTEFPENWWPQIFYEGRFYYELCISTRSNPSRFPVGVGCISRLEAAIYRR